LKEFLKGDITKYRTKIFSILEKAGIQAVASIELSRTIPRIGKANNMVHFHILTDDDRSEFELRKLFNKACEDSGLEKKKDFKIDCRKIENGYWYFDYFTKFDRKSRGKYMKSKDRKEASERKWSWLTVLLFDKIRMQKFYQIGKWFDKSKGEIWKEIQALAAENAAAKTEAETPEKEIDDQEGGKETGTRIKEF